MFISGFIACGGLLGGLCAFIYWMFSITEKRLEDKLETLNTEIHRIVDELKAEREERNKQTMRLDGIYTVLLNNSKNK